jgi:AraC-like DNA-binding protein
MLETYRRELPEPPEESPPQVGCGYRCIKKHLFSLRLTVRWLKDECNINGNNFSGKFRYFVGRPPQNYIVRNRVDAAAKVLKNVDPNLYSLLELACEVGYSGHSSFTRSFKRVMGKAPAYFRANENVK